MDDPRVFQGQRHRQICLGPQREGRMEERQRAVGQHAMGRNHHRDEEGARRCLLCKMCIIVSCNSQSSKIHCCRCTLKILFKRVDHETPDKNRWWSSTSNRKFVVKGNLESQLLVLLQPRTSPRANEKRLRTMDDGRSVLSRRTCKIS